MRNILIRLIVNAIALYVATQVHIPGLSFDGTWTAMVIVAFIFGLVNALVRPLLTLLTCPLLILTLGLFTLIINALMLMLTGWIARLPQLHLGFSVDGFAAAFVGALVVSIVSFVITLLLHEDGESHNRR